MEISLLRANDIESTIQNKIALLYKQLNANNKQRTLKEILAPDNTVRMAMYKEDDEVCGIALMVTYKVISGHRGLVEDVVVAAKHRGKGIGRKLMEKLLSEGEKMGLDEILLFTGHHRTPAIALYKSLGFKLRESGLYNMKLTN